LNQALSEAEDVVVVLTRGKGQNKIGCIGGMMQYDGMVALWIDRFYKIKGDASRTQRMTVINPVYLVH